MDSIQQPFRMMMLVMYARGKLFRTELYNFTIPGVKRALMHAVMIFMRHDAYVYAG